MKTEYQILQELTRLENLNVNPEVDYLTRISALKWVLDAGEVGNVAKPNACHQLCEVTEDRMKLDCVRCNKCGKVHSVEKGCDLPEAGGGVMLLEEIKLNIKISIFERIKSAFAYALLAEVPPCCGERDGWSGEFDCTYEHGIDCDTCVCLYYEHGYRKGIDPRTGKDFKKFRRHFI